MPRLMTAIPEGDALRQVGGMFRCPQSFSPFRGLPAGRAVATPSPASGGAVCIGSLVREVANASPASGGGWEGEGAGFYCAKIGIYLVAGLLAFTGNLARGTDLGQITTHPDVLPPTLNTATVVPATAYRPAFSPLGRYSIEKACKVNVDESWPQVTLHDQGHETLNAAFERLLTKGKANGILNVRWDAPPSMCDTLYSGKNKLMSGTLVIRGLTGPHGEQPRLYCRSAIRDGNVPNSDVAGTVLFAYGRTLTVIENLHIDGYKVAVRLPAEGRMVVRNNYLHHQISNAVSGSNITRPNLDVSYEFCGNEMSHGGRDNGSHLFYVHRGLPESTTVSALWVDNFLHSAAHSSAIKSIANINTIINNRLSKQVTTDPSFTPRSSQFLIDVPGCSQNHIEGNLIEGPKLDGASGGRDLVGIRNRKTELLGCDRPKYDSAQWHDPAYWASLKGVPPFKTLIKGNTFRTRPAGFTAKAFDNRLIAIHDWGTWPNTGPGLNDSRIMLPVPPGYFELHETVVEGNTYIGPFAALYASDNITHCTPGKEVKNWGACPPYPNPGPKEPANFIRVGPGETRVGAGG